MIPRCGYPVPYDFDGCCFPGWWAGRCYWHDKLEHGVDIALPGPPSGWIPAAALFVDQDNEPAVDLDTLRGIRYLIDLGGETHVFSA